MKKIVILTGAGISAESGLKTFRDTDGLWEGYHISEVATPEAWLANPEFVQEFYNERRKLIMEAVPNKGHEALVKLEEKYQVQIITQNIDDLHERAGSSNVLHLHGVITLAQSDVDASLTYPISGWELGFDQTCVHNKPLRPHVVWFGEAVPNMEPAIQICRQADIFMVIGTSLQVYPAAGLLEYVPRVARKYVIDPKVPPMRNKSLVTIVEQAATIGIPMIVEELLKDV